MNVRAKMKAESVLKVENAETTTFSAVYANGEANKDWSKWTPSASISITITNPACFGAFIPGAEYFVDFSPATEQIAE